ncbi:MAG: hypothetical protein Greene041619_402 [Candidatus Peregrinibacteria bacterium Greene0416_19]|nr:MAG: hypothetical protein Greene041619_402 [Candidatus Peregrinibacteria bacterium Greene0416_19]
MERPTSPVASALPSRGRIAAIVIAFLALALLVYGRSLGNDFVRWDDGLLIFENPAVRSFSLSSLRTIFTSYDPELYIPFTFLAYQFDYLIGGTHATVYHLHILLLHVMNALLVAWVLFLLWGRTVRATRGGIPALCGGLLFLVHPLHTEAVAWASAMKDVQSTFFFLASFITYIYYRCEQRKSLYWWSIGLFACGLLSKVMVATLPVALLLLNWRNSHLDRQTWLEKIPYFLLALMFGFVAVVGKSEAMGASDLVTTILMAAKSTIFYLQKFVLPFGLSVMYPWTQPVSISSPSFFVPLAVLLVIVAGVLATIRRTKDIAFGFFFFLVTLAPTFFVYAKGNDLYIASDRYAYIPSIGMILLVCLIVEALWLRIPTMPRSPKSPRNVFILGILGLIGFFGFLSYRQSRVWQNTEALFTHALTVQPRAFVAHMALGSLYLRQGKLAEAAEHLRHSIELRDHHKARTNLGHVYAKQGRWEDARREIDRARDIDPESVEPLLGLAILHTQAGRIDDALVSYDAVIAMQPRNAKAYLNKGSILLDQGRTAAAVAAFKEAIRIEPLFHQAHYNLGIAYTSQGRLDDAIAQYEETIRIAPEFRQAHLNLGVLYAKIGRLQDATEAFEAVLEIDPGNAAARSALEQLRRFPNE